MDFVVPKKLIKNKRSTDRDKSEEAGAYSRKDTPHPSRSNMPVSFLQKCPWINYKKAVCQIVQNPADTIYRRVTLGSVSGSWLDWNNNTSVCYQSLMHWWKFNDLFPMYHSNHYPEAGGDPMHYSNRDWNDAAECHQLSRVSLQNVSIKLFSHCINRNVNRLYIHN